MGCCQTQLTFKDFIHPHDDAKILASSLGATLVVPKGKELEQSGPFSKENANTCRMCIGCVLKLHLCLQCALPCMLHLFAKLYKYCICIVILFILCFLLFFFYF